MTGLKRSVLGLALGLMVSAACVQQGAQNTTRENGNSLPPTSLESLTAHDLKPVLTGLLDRQGLPSERSRALVNGFVIDVPWSDIEPEPGVLPQGNPIDVVLDVLRSQPSSSPDMKIKLRVRAGVQAPEWAKQLGGGSVNVVDNQASGTVGRFWTDAYGQAYRRLQEMLAAEYDAAPEILQVTISRCTTFFAEPMLRQWGDEETQSNLLRAGYTADADERCQREEIDAHSVWVQTRSGLAVNPYQRIDPQGVVSADEPFTEAVMLYCRRTLGERCVLENYSVRWPLQPEPYPTMYTAMKELGPPLAFQTAARPRIGSYEDTLRWVVELGANSLELNRDYPRYDPEILAEVSRRLAANPSGS